MLQVLEKSKDVSLLNEIFSKPIKVAVGDLVRPMFVGNDYICKKYFTNETGHSCYNCRAFITKKDYEEIVKTFKSVKNPENLVFETASKYYKDKALVKMLSKDFGMEISLEGRCTEESDFRYSSFIAQEVYDEDLFRENELELPEPTKVALDYEVYEELYKVIFKAIKKRYVMILELSGIVPLLNNIREYMCNTGNPTKNMLDSMYALKARIEKTLTNSEVQEWLALGINDIQVYAQDESTRQDYIRTYQGVLRMLSGIKPGESLEYMRDIVHNDSDVFEDEIIANEGFDIESFQTNLDYDEE
jgi:hypothetical protein